MRKLLSIVLALTLVLGMLPVFADQVFDVENTGAKNLKHYGFIGGDENGNLKENEVLTREQLAIVLATLHGKFEQAKAFEAATGYADESEFPAWSKNFISYAKAQGWLVGNDKNMFDNKGVVSAEMLASVFLRILGHVTAEKPVEWGKNVETLKEKTEIEVRGNALTRGEAFEAMWIAVSTPVMSVKGKVLGVELGKLVFDKFEISEIKATSTKTIELKFTKALSEEEKKNLEVTVNRGKTKLDVTQKWHDSNDVLVLSSKTNFPQAEIEVEVKYEKADMKTEKITFSQQKIAKIEFLSDAVNVDPSTGTGYVIYKVYDQYGQDVTDSYLGAIIKFEVGGISEKPVGKNGVLTLKPNTGQSLLTFTQIPIVAYDINSGINVSVSLPTANRIGTISNFQFGDASKIQLTDGDLATVYYLPYEALDQSGSKTENYELISKGLVGEEGKKIHTSINRVKARLVKNPKDASKALVELRVTSDGSSVPMDLPVTITTMTYTGKSTTTTVMLNRAKEIQSITLLPPSRIISATTDPVSIDIPYEAFDQDGNKITNYSQIKGKVSFSPNSMLDVYEDVTGVAKLRYKNGSGAAEGTLFLSATVTKTGKFSSLQINVQKTAEVERMEYNRSGSSVAYEHGAAMPLNGYYAVDQYNARIGLPVKYGFIFSFDANNIDKVQFVGGSQIGTTNINKGATAIQAKVVDTTNEISVPVTITLVKDNTITDAAQLFAKNNVVDSKTFNFITIPTANIVDFNIEVSDKIYANTNFDTITDRDYAYAIYPVVTGNSAGGTKNVQLNQDNLKIVNTVENKDEFKVMNIDQDITDGIDNNNGKLTEGVIASRPKGGKLESSTYYTVAITHASRIASKAITLKGVTEVPTAKTIKFVGTFGHDADGNVKIPAATFSDLNNKYAQRYRRNNTVVVAGNYASNLAFSADDQYNSNAVDLTFTMVLVEGDGTTNKMTISPEGMFAKVGSGAVAGQKYRLTATAANGKTYSVVITVE